MNTKKKRIIFDDTDHRHAQLKLRLNYDNLTQAEFFRAFLTGYLNKDELIMEYITKHKEAKKIQSKAKLKIIEEESKKADQLMNKFGIKDGEIEDILDIIANEHPEL